MIKKHWRWLAAILMVVTVGYFIGVGRGPRTTHLEPGSEVATDFTLTDVKGQQVRLSDFKGKIILLDFWATWCLPCLQELPDLKALYEKYKGEGFVILGVSLDEAGRDVVAEFVKKHQMPYPMLLAGGVDNVPEGYSVIGLPTAYLIDSSGYVRKNYVGFKFRETLEKDIRALLPAAKGDS